MGPAVVLSRLVDLTGRNRLLDVAGGSGAFSIMLCQRNPRLKATILDFPAVGPIAAKFVGEAGLADRIEFLGGNAFETDWPAGVDVVLISYLLSAIGGAAVPGLFRRAFEALAPCGQLLLHDFMVDDDGTGPATAALWLLCSLLSDPEAILLKPAALTAQLSAAGFTNMQVLETIPTITRTIVATKL
jgi:2-hydroxy-4-(methylsulfanyl)butanoate S-methyltransferase